MHEDEEAKGETPNTGGVVVLDVFVSKNALHLYHFLIIVGPAKVKICQAQCNFEKVIYVTRVRNISIWSPSDQLRNFHSCFI